MNSANSFVETTANAVRNVLQQIVGTDVKLEHTAGSVQDATVLVHFSVGGQFSGGFHFCFCERDALKAAALLTGEAVEESNAFTAESREALEELLRQICGEAAASIRKEYGATDIRHVAQADEDKDGQETYLFILETSNTQLQFELAISQTLLESLSQNANAASETKPATTESRAPETDSVQPPEEQEESAHNGKNSGSAIGSEKTIRLLRDGNLDMLLDLELPVSLRFGRRDMQLREILELTSGSVVELDRRLQEPVDLLVSNKLVARGEVVIVNGNYGLRVTEVAADREKVACFA